MGGGGGWRGVKEGGGVDSCAFLYKNCGCHISNQMFQKQFDRRKGVVAEFVISMHIQVARAFVST